MRLERIVASRLPLLQGVDSWDDPRVEQFSLPARAWKRPAVEVTHVNADDELGVPIRAYQPVPIGRTEGALLWVHGGGFAGGSIDMPESDYVATELAARADVVVVTLDYRLVNNEIHYPLPVDDVLDAWAWLRRNTRSFGVSGPICLGGASAGGCLAVSATLRLQEEGETMPRALLLAYPALHAKLPSLSPEDEQELTGLPPLFQFSAAQIAEMFERYLGPAPCNADGFAVPGGADPQGLPQTLIVNSHYDHLRASGETFARSLKSAGVDVECVYEPATIHGHLNTIGLEAGEATLARMSSFLGLVRR